jgi:hypothetical protein
MLDDLRPEPNLSPFLDDLRSGHRAEMPDPPVPPLFAHKVVFGDDDRIVQPNEFYPGEPYVRWKGHDHLSLCKADDNFREPLQIVLEALA